MNAADLYVQAVVNRHRASEEDGRPGRVRRQVEGLLRFWKYGRYLESVTVSGSWAKATALRDSDVDLFLSLSPETPGALKWIQGSLAEYLRDNVPRPRNVSVRIRLEGGTVDLTPGRRRAGSTHHSLWQLRYGTWLQTDIREQIRQVRAAGLASETLALKLWRRRNSLRFPSFLLELCAIRALRERGRISESLLKLLEFLAEEFPGARLTDPANSNNAVSDALTPEEKARIATAAGISLRAVSWTEIL